jgi:hypothetical protein
MPRAFADRKPVIVYLDKKLYDQMQALAKQQDRSMSYVGRRLIAVALQAKPVSHDAP